MFFDLKGSTKGRTSKFPRNESLWWQKKQWGNKKVMKDNNFLQIDHDFQHSLITMEEEIKNKYKKMIAADSMFLRVHNLIDYSLLLVIETIHQN